MQPFLRNQIDQLPIELIMKIVIKIPNFVDRPQIIKFFQKNTLFITI